MDFKEAMAFRHACKIFDESKKISDADFAAIIEAGRMSASSMGMQPWEFELVTNKELLAKIKKACWDQPQITTASHTVVIWAKIADLRADSAYAAKVIAARGDKTSEQQAAYKEAYANMIAANEGRSDDALFSWARAQCYIAAANMMMQAAFLGIDSCPIEGFVRGDLEGVLGSDSAQKRVAMVLPFGYRLNPQPREKYRREYAEVLSVRA